MKSNPLEIIHKLSRTLEVENKPLLIQQLTGDSQLPSRTLKRHMQLMEAAKESPDLRIITSSRRGMVEPTGFLSLPERERLSYLRIDYPELKEEGLLMLKLYGQGAVSRENGIKMIKTKSLDELLDAKQVKEVDGKFFLTELGEKVAEGTLKIYPKLRGMKPE
ncbi:MAG: hypothetical protein U9Q22_02160 [Candidatus Altiarchaeota archaeon]|nr:hypothetical protein [Candidatus Altiarchaeota archaeon]